MAAAAGRQPAAAACRRANAAPPTVLQRSRRPTACLLPAAVLPPDALEALPTAAAAAAAASLLTSAWMHLAQGTPASNAAEQQRTQAQQEPQQEAEPPGSPEAVWTAAWQGFAPPAQPPEVAEPDAAGADETSAGRASGQPELAAEDAEEGPEPQQSGLQRSPVLLLEGIRAVDRSRLLALCLAALESQVVALPAAPGLLGAGPAEWRQLAAALLALSSVAAAAAWLGYVPACLLEAAAAQLAAVDAQVLQTTGLQAAAAALQQQAAAAGGSGSDGEAEEVEGGSKVEWYCLQEKLQLYSSVLRLLSCAIIEQQQAGTVALPPAASAASSDSGDARPAVAGSSSSSGGEPFRRQAQAALLQHQAGGVPAGLAGGGVRGWRATAAGTRSETQLLSLAPAALQDMAVTAADAVAAAYLADAATAGPSVVSRQPATGAASSSQAAAPATEQPGQASVGSVPSQQQQQGAAPALRSSDVSAGSSGAGSGTRPLEAGWWATFVHRQLHSTRQLQRFANGVTLQRWLYLQYHGVVDIYEDRLQLWAISHCGRRLESRHAPLKRTSELGRLSGLRYAASLLLEAADLLVPLLRTLWQQATSAASWLLVRLVGQAVALVRRGLRQGAGQAAAAAAQGKPQAAKQQQQRRRPGRRRQAGDDEFGGSQPSWAWGG